ncbi:MAG: SLC13 family permease [Spirochaetes bacterium]|nr:SLC13 family permease [Spirochaetota bacterium]
MSQLIVFITLGITLALFAWGKIRHDFVSLIALFIATVTGIVPSSDAFSGFGHPAVITVASVLIIGAALERSGVIDLLGQVVSKVGNNLMLQIASLSVITAFASAFMNNVGALAIMMPVAIFLARKAGNSPSMVLMPIAFASLLGGMTTLIGTPPNIIIATIRADHTGEAFGMFQFAAVGFFVVIAGIFFITLIGWRLLPVRSPDGSSGDLFKIDDYITEVKVVSKSKIRGITIADVRKKTESEVTILGMVRQRQRIHAPSPDEILKVNDILIIETGAEDLKTFINNSGAKLVGGKKFRTDARGSKDIEVAEAVVMNDSPLTGESAVTLSMRSRYGINLLAVARRETKITSRMDHVVFMPGDVILLQGRSHMLHETINSMKCLPLAKRGLRLGYEKRLVASLGIFGLSIFLVVVRLLPVQVSFGMAAVTFVLTGLLPVKDVYKSVDWPVIVMLGAMIPLGQALETTGGAELIASLILNLGNSLPPWAMLTIVLVVTMFLSDIINNAATVVLMAPIGINIAAGIDASIDPFLIAVAIGGSSAFLTPIGHQSNTLVMGPGGYKFFDYWRMGFPLEILIAAVSVPLIMFFWPLY